MVSEASVCAQLALLFWTCGEVAYYIESAAFMAADRQGGEREKGTEKVC